jgi:hypothetical protein
MCVHLGRSRDHDVCFFTIWKPEISGSFAAEKAQP